jgi:hypothetical protein
MKTSRIIYIISVSICALELLMFLCSPFGGPLTIINLMKNGLFSAQEGYRVIPIRSMYSPGDKHIRYLEIMNSAFTSCYFLSLMGSCLSLLLLKLNKKTKYKIGIILFTSSLLFSFIGGAILHYLVRIWLLN